MTAGHLKSNTLRMNYTHHMVF